MEIDNEGIKIVLVGESGVGKTSIIKRFIENNFEYNTQPSLGGSFFTKSLIFNDGEKLTFNIWDTAGQEKFRALTQIFYKDAKFAILVYDITQQNSYDELIKFWFNKVKENTASNIILVLAANKSDLAEQEEVNETKAREFAQSIGAIFALTSAQNNSGINELFRDVGNKYLDPNFQQKLEEEKEEKNQEGQTNIVLDKKEAEKPAKKKKGFC